MELDVLVRRDGPSPGAGKAVGALPDWITGGPPLPVDEQVAGDLEQPRPFTAGQIETPGCAQQSHEHVLRQVLGDVPPSSHPEQVAVDRQVKAVEQVRHRSSHARLLLHGNEREGQESQGAGEK